MGFIQSAIAARGRGDMAATWSNAQAAMNADPTSTAVQSFYSAVQGERAQTQDTRAFIQQAVQAMGAGNGEEAVAWARRAHERSPGEDTKDILEDVQRRSAGLKTPSPDQAPAPKGGVPLLPLMAAGAGLTALGLYKVALSRGTSTSEDGLNPSPEVSPEQARRNYVNSVVVIGTPIVVAALVYGGPMAWRAVAPTATTLLRGGQQSIQRVTASEAGALFPEEQAASRLAQRAPSALQGEQLREHLRQLQKYGTAGFRELEDGAIRYYERIKPADKVGRMLGARRVREWNPNTGQARVWFETIDEAGKVRIVRPETGGDKVHYYFNEVGEFIGSK